MVSLIYSWLPNSVTKAELQRLRKGMSQEMVLEALGQPDDTGYDDEGYEVWRYGFLGSVIIFDNDGGLLKTDIFKHPFYVEQPKTLPNP